MTMTNRPPVPQETQAEVLSLCARRCCICFGIDNDYNEKSGQIAHLDKKRDNNKLDNLAFLCFDHHNKYDSTMSQSKNYQLLEVKKYRSDLHETVANNKSLAYASITQKTIDKNKNIQGLPDIRSEIRKFLDHINPDILKTVDTGSNEVGVMINSAKLILLDALTTDPNFCNYLKIQPTGSVIMGGRENIIGDSINDISSGLLLGYVLFPTDKLKS